MLDFFGTNRVDCNKFGMLHNAACLLYKLVILLGLVVFGAFAELLLEYVDWAERPNRHLQVCLLFFVEFLGYQSSSCSISSSSSSSSISSSSSSSSSSSACNLSDSSVTANYEMRDGAGRSRAGV